jgi:hypothetical protein
MLRKTQGLLALRAEHGSKIWAKILMTFTLWVMFLAAVFVLMIRRLVMAGSLYSQKNRDEVRRKGSVSVLGVLLLLTMSCASCTSEKAVGIEQARYTVVAKEGKFEIRRYEPCVVAETLVESDFRGAGNVAFRKLFNYISGQNRRKESIAMRAPVNPQAGSEKIAMTAPANQLRSQDRWVVSLVLPSQYTIQSLPEPLDPAVTLREVPGRKMAAVRYSGTWSQRRYEQNNAYLETLVRDKEMQISGEAIFARYDPPFQLFFLRRNEGLISVD